MCGAVVFSVAQDLLGPNRTTLDVCSNNSYC